MLSLGSANTYDKRGQNYMVVFPSFQTVERNEQRIISFIKSVKGLLSVNMYIIFIQLNHNDHFDTS